MNIPCRLISCVVIALLLANCSSGRRAANRVISDEDPLSFIGRTTQAPVEASAARSEVAGTASSATAPGRPGTSAGGLTRAEIYLGTGATVGLGRRPSSGPAVDGVSLDFVDADIRELVDLVLGDVLRTNYVIDPEIEARITIRSIEPVATNDLLPLLEDLLAINGYALLTGESLVRVVPLNRASQSIESAFVMRSSSRKSGFGAYVIPLRHVSGDLILEVAQSLVGPGRLLKSVPGRNLLLFVGPGSDARELETLVSTFDVDWMEGMSFAFLPLEVADPTQVTAELRSLFLLEEDDASAPPIDFMPINRMNAILAIAAEPSYIDKAQIWVDRLDRGVSGPGRRLYVYHVENRRAEDLAEALQPLFEPDRASPRGQAARFLPASGRMSSLPGGEEGVALADGQGVPDDGLSEPRLGSFSAFEIAGAQLGAPGRAPGSEELGAFAVGDDIRIIANAESNSLLIVASPREFRMIEAALKELDSEPLQVLVEVTIAEIRLDDDLQYGLRWFFRDGDQSVTFSTLASGAVASAFPGFSYALATEDIQVVLNALTSITDVRVVSSPQLMVLDNQAARLRVGDQVPIATQSAVSVTDPTAPLVNTIQFKDTGVILEVTPRVNSSGLVVLEVVQEVSDVVATTTSDIDSPTIQQRSIESTVAIHSGQTVALGGLIRDRNEESVTGVPLLSDIPVLGNLFKTTGNAARRTELLVLITPRVVLNQDDARGVTEELRRRMEGLGSLARPVE